MKNSKTPAKAEASLRSSQTIAKYRAALIRLVRRQLDCARRGLIGTPAYWRAYRADLMKLSTYSLIARIEPPLVDLIPSDDDPDTWRWAVQEAVAFPPARPFQPECREVYYFDHDDLEAMNLIAANVLADWVDRVTKDPKDTTYDGSFMPVSWFKGAKIHPSTLQTWKKAGKIKTRGEKPHTLFDANQAFVLWGIQPEQGFALCSKAWDERKAVVVKKPPASNGVQRGTTGYNGVQRR
jgi:hypothetical protein